ncbi:MAG: SGNH/GDSL hydrolase family protein [Candidatus Woesearchaeota archaeon]|nr:SGNH/GDSL hydrolase family protein [Candidatus Woesearchaeota archaeon]
MLLLILSNAILNHTSTDEYYHFTLEDIANGLTVNKNISISANGVTRHYNSNGFADYEFSKKKDNGIYRVLVIGDSFTFGYGNPANETYPKLLEKRLNSNPDKQYEIFNLGLSGLNTYLEFSLLSKITDELNPDLIIVGFFMNDLDTEWIPGQEKCLEAKEARIKNGAIYLYNIVRYFPLTRADMYFLGQYVNNDRGWNCFKEGLSGLNNLSSQKNVPIIFVDVTLANKGHKFYPKLTEMTDKEIKRYFKMYHVDIPKDSVPFDMFYNEYKHYSLKGNELIAKSVALQIFNISAQEI